jgi:hypothetical protein
MYKNLKMVMTNKCNKNAQRVLLGILIAGSLVLAGKDAVNTVIARQKLKNIMRTFPGNIARQLNNNTYLYPVGYDITPEGILHIGYNTADGDHLLVEEPAPEWPFGQNQLLEDIHKGHLGLPIKQYPATRVLRDVITHGGRATYSQASGETLSRVVLMDFTKHQRSE